MSEQPRYSMLIEWSDEDHLYIVSLPEWGKYAQTHGTTYEEAVRNGQEVLQMLIDGARTAHEPLPAPRVYARAS
jgi:predicted RNase H-like HicB family nuclease